MRPNVPGGAAGQAPRAGRRRVLAALAASSHRRGSTRPPAAEPARTHRVVIQGLLYRPETLVVRRGDTVVWVNDDPMPHTVTAAGEFDSRTIDAGKSWRFWRVAPAPIPTSARCTRTWPARSGRLTHGASLARDDLVTLVLRGAEQHLARVVVADRLAQSGEHLDAALHRGPRRDASNQPLGCGRSVQSMPWFFQLRSHGKIAMSAIVYSSPAMYSLASRLSSTP